MGPGSGNGRARGQANGRRGAQNEAEREAVVVKATGKAVEKAMGLAVAMMAEKGWRVRVRTGSVAAIDDVVIGDVEEEVEEKEKEQAQGEEGVTQPIEASFEVAAEDETGTEAMDVDTEGDSGIKTKEPTQVEEEHEAESEEELPETRIRYTGMLEIEVTLRNDDENEAS